MDDLPDVVTKKRFASNTIRRMFPWSRQGRQIPASSVPEVSKPAVPQASKVSIIAEEEEIASTVSLGPVLPKRPKRIPSAQSGSFLSDNSLGLKVLVNGVNPDVDIIAVHGLNGHREKTWTASNGTLWLSDLLPSFVENARIISYGYDARTHGSAHMTVQFLYDHALTFVSRLCTLRRSTKTEERPIIFFAHSLGGILVKSALIHSSFCTISHLPEHLSVKLSTYGIFFFGTPHTGSGGAAWATALLKIGSAFSKTNTLVVKHLKSNSEWLRQQIDQFTSISENFRMIFCYEGYPTSLALGTSTVIVSRESAVITGAPNSEVLCFAKDHKELVRFADPNDEDFKSVVSHIIAMTNACQDTIARNWAAQGQVQGNPAENVNDWSRSTPNVFNLPLRLPIARNPGFIGRKSHLTQIDNHLFPPLGGYDQAVVADGRTVVLYGLGGMGKTQLALNYAAGFSDKFSAVHCIDGSNEISARLGFRDIAQRYVDVAMALDEGEERDKLLRRLHLAAFILPNGQMSNDNLHLAGITKAVTGFLEEDGNDKWLLIIDNMDELDNFPIQDFLPRTPARRVIITTRLTAAIRLGYAVEVDGIDEADAVSILLNSTRLRAPTTSDDVYAKDIARTLGYLPLAIEQAGAYISDVQIQLCEYLPLYEKHHRDLLRRPTTCDIYNPRRETVFTTWEVSYEMLEIQDPAAAEMMLLLAFLHQESAWEGLFELALGHEGNNASTKLPKDFEWLIELCADKLALKSAFGRIMSFSLAKRGVAPPPGSVVLHPLVHAWGRDRLPPSKRQQKMVHALFIIGSASETLSESPTVPEYGDLKRRLMRNADACIGFVKLDDCSDIYHLLISEPKGITALYHIAILYLDFRRFQQAEDLLNYVLNSTTINSNPGLHAECQRRLADIFEQQGKYERAQVLYELAISTLTDLYGDRDIRVLAATNGLGAVLWETRRLPEARQVFQIVLAKINESSPILGEVGRRAGSVLSLVYLHLGLVVEAEACQRRVLADIDADEKLDIFSALEPRYHMALILTASGRWTEAEAVFSNVLAERLKLLGPETLDVTRTANALGRTLYFLGQYERSRELLDFAWKQQQKLKLGNMHRAVLRTLFNIGVLNREQGLYDEALELLERCSALQSKIGERTDFYLLCQIDLAILKNECGQPQEGLVILEKVRTIQRDKLLPC